jgi:hypothetical protein
VLRKRGFSDEQMPRSQLLLLGYQAERPYFFWNLPTRPAVSMIFCWPV